MALRVALAETDPAARQTLRSLLEQQNYEVELLEGGEAISGRLLEADSPRVAICGWPLSGLDIVDLCRRLREREEDPYTYLILLTDWTERVDVAAALEAGVDDFLSKPVNSEEVQVRLLMARQRLSSREHQRHAEEFLSELSLRDSLTEAWNRSAILEFLEREVARLGRNKSSLGLVLMDVDRLREINDRHGQQAGDRVLRDFGRRLKTAVRSTDWIGRYGGEEFLIVLPKCSLERAEQTAQRMRRVVTGRPIAAGELRLEVRVSCGVSAASGGGASAKSLLRNAENALEQAKARGGDRIHSIPPAGKATQASADGT